MSENEIYEELLKSRKYADITPEVLLRVSRDAAARYPKKKDALKAAKTELHIINDSYLLNDCHKNAMRLIDGCGDTDILSDRSFAVSLLQLHASSKERLSFIEEIYGFLSDHVSEETTLGDIGCGFSPFALPFLAHKPGSYFAYEINNETVDTINAYFGKIGVPGYKAAALDAVSNTPCEHFDTVFLFKLLPVLQQQKKGRAFEFLKELDFSSAIVSFPLKSLSGKEKGMSEHYSSFFEDGADGELSITEKRSIGNELFYVIRKNG